MTRLQAVLLAAVLLAVIIVPKVPVWAPGAQVTVHVTLDCPLHAP